MIRALVLLLALLPGLSRAEAPPSDIVTVEVLPGWQIGDGRHMAALRLTLAPGWKTYWRAPGDAGIPPLFDWSGSRNLGGVRLHWPVPEVWGTNGMRSIGYHDGVILPVEITRSGPGPVRLSGEMDLGVCEDICVPARVRFDAELPADGRRDPRIVAALVDRPLTADEAGVGSVSCRIAPAALGLSVTATLSLPPVGGSEDMVIETGDPTTWVSEPELSRQGDRLVATARIVPATDGIAIDRSALRLTILSAGRAVDIRGCPAG